VKHQVVVNVMLKEGIADPQGGTIERALPALGFDGVEGVRVGKRIEFTLDIGDDAQIEERVEAMCRSLLANPVIESYEVIVG
jgi:phosphoribosylformylglycinamidine synthase subunit PurS